MPENINLRLMLPVGALLQNGKYRIERYLSSGGFGNTYVAYNTEFQETVALKEFFMNGVTQRDENHSVSVSNAEKKDQFEQQREKFKKEARRIRKLHNDHIVAVHDLFEENGTAYYVMDYIDGESLSERVKRTGLPLTEREVCDYLPQILDALRTVHDQSIWHLDIKPANIMVDHDGHIYLIDFGASKQISQSGAATSSMVAYTPGYASPEQIDQNSSRFGPWTDLYSLGATIYYLLTVNRPPSPTDITVDGDRAFHYGGNVSEKMKQLVRWFMDINYMNRPQSVEQCQPMVDELMRQDDFNVNNDDVTIEVSPSVVPVPHKKKPVTAIVAGIIGFVLMVIVLAIFIPKGAKTPSSSPQPSNSEELVETPKTVSQQLIKDPADGSEYTYSGDLDENGLPHGQGEASWKNSKRYYRGEFVHGKMEGKCDKNVDPDGNVFVGTMSAGKYNRGRITMTDGTYFDGEMRDNGPWTGTYYKQDGSVIGRYENGQEK